MTGSPAGHEAKPLVAVLLGTRPEAIKLAPVILALRSLGTPVAVIGTGQHAELVDQVFATFGLQLDQDLELMRPGQSLDHVLASSVSGVGELLDDYRPDLVIVQGDTSSALGCAIAAFHRRIPVAHVEAGLRSFDLDLPFPEEMNRRAISIIARHHFAPTEQAAANLRAEGVTEGVHVVGNTVVDALNLILARRDTLPRDLADFTGRGPFILATAHRRESWHGGIEAVAGALVRVLDDMPDHHLVFVTHANPVARAPVVAMLAGHPRAMIPGPMPYDVFLGLLSRARLAVSDSGGIQEEGPTLGVPVVVTRERTERREAVDAGAAALVGLREDNVHGAVLGILSDPARHARMSKAGRHLYGDGRAGERIAAVLGSALSGM